MPLQDEIERAALRASVRREIEALLKRVSPDERRTMLLDLFVAEAAEAAGPVPASTDVVYAAGLVFPTAPVPHGSRGDQTVSFLRENGGATVEEVAVKIYGGLNPDTRKKAASMLSLLRSPGGGRRVDKDDETDIWNAVEPPKDPPASW